MPGCGRTTAWSFALPQFERAEVHLIVGERLLEQSLTTLRLCGEGSRECMLFWLAACDGCEQVVEVAHLPHAATHGSCEIDGRALNGLWRRLATEDLRIVAQVHTHPGAAFHSRTDDQFPVLPRVGLLSLVVPNFALTEFDPSECFLGRLEADGSWTQLDPERAVSWPRN